jgi:hypothetical protein
MNDEWVEVRKEAIMTCFMTLFQNSLGENEEITKNLS